MTFLYVILLAIFLQVSEVEPDVYRKSNSRCDKIVSFRASRNVSYRESYRVSKWAIFYETKYRWKYRKEVNHLILREEFPFSLKLVD